MMRKVRQRKQEAELDITSFMNLMIILVPVLLMSMVFSHVTVLDLKLPDMVSSDNPQDDKKNQKLELVIHDDYIDVNYPAGIRLKRIGKTLVPTKAPAKKSAGDEGGVDDANAEPVKDYDYTLLSNVLQEIKRQLNDKSIEKKDILILSQVDTDYQTLVSVMDTVRSFKAVVAASAVDAELFPEISLGDAPVSEKIASAGGAK